MGGGASKSSVKNVSLSVQSVSRSVANLEVKTNKNLLISVAFTSIVGMGTIYYIDLIRRRIEQWREQSRDPWVK